VEGEIVGWSTMYVGEGFAFLGNSFTLEPFRNLGVQAALLQARIADALASGLTDIYVDVEPDSISERNCRRAGFEVISRKQVWVRAAS
jgi:hypothetical protein